MSQAVSRIIYPIFPDVLTESDVVRLFSISHEHEKWGFTIARRGPSLVMLHTHLKVFQFLGRFLGVADLPQAAINHISKHFNIKVPAAFDYDRRTLYRHHRAIRQHLGITPWGAKAGATAEGAIATAAETRLDPADLINAAVDALIRERYELPLLSKLRTLAGTAHRFVNTSQWNQIDERLSEADRRQLDALLVPHEDTPDSLFAVTCRGARKATRENLKAVIAHYQWLRTPINPTPLLAPISEAKVAQWANEAWQAGRRQQTEQLVQTLAEILTVLGTNTSSAKKIRRVEASIAAHGGIKHLQKACDEHLSHSDSHWQPFAREAFSPFRAELLRLARTLPLKAARPPANDLIRAVFEVSDEPSEADYYIMDLGREFLPARWRALIADDPLGNPQAFNRRHLEVAVMLELAEAIKTGAVHVTGSVSYDDFWGRLPPEASDPTRIAAYSAERGWRDSAQGFTRHTRE